MTLVVAMPFIANAANDLTFVGTPVFLFNTSDTAVPVSVTGSNGGVVTAITVDTNFMNVTVDSGSSATWTIPSGYYFNYTHQSGSVSNYTVTPSCLTQTLNVSATGNAVFKVTVSTVAPSCSTSTSTPITSGTGGGVPLIPSGSFNINNGAISTNTQSVSLNINASYVSTMLVSEDPSFIGAFPVTYVPKYNFILSNGTGVKTVYIRLINGVGFTTISNTINLETSVTTPPATATQCTVDCKKVAYDLYIINPNGSERHMGTKYAKETDITSTKKRIGFEDSGSDFDHNDLVVEVEKSDCKSIKVSVVGLDAGWHHKIMLKVFLENTTKLITVSNDSHQAVGTTVDLKITTVLNSVNQCVLQAQDIITGPISQVPIGDCKVTTPFISFLASGQVSAEVTRLQELLKCLGYFPSTQVVTGRFGLVTDAAVKDFQKANGIDQVGYVGPATRTALNKYYLSSSTTTQNIEPSPTITFVEKSSCTSSTIFNQYLEKGIFGDQVLALQNLLKCLGYFPVTQTTTGEFGSLTELSVINFQKYHKLDPLGVVGPATRAELNKY